MKFREYDQWDAVEMSELVHAKAISPTELLESAIETIETRNPAINAVTTKTYDEARAQIAKGLGDGPLAGVPLLLKDLAIQYKGVVTSAGSRLCADAVADHHSTLTQRYMQAGAVILGKSNSPEFGVSGSTESELLGPCKNPWDTSRSAGGSSGGAAAAVAARLTPVAHASDAGGSIRNPSSVCGVFGLKTTRARTPLGPLISEGSGGLSIQHVITRSVRDSAAFLDASAGPATGDAYTAPGTNGFLKALASPLTRKLRIAVHTEPYHNVAIDHSCIEAVQQTAKLCESLGHIVEEGQPDINGDEEMAVNSVLWSVNLANTAKSLFAAKGIAPSPQYMEKNTWNMVELGLATSGTDYIQAVQKMHRTSRKIAALFETYDVVLSPVLSRPAWKLGTYEAGCDDVAAYFRRIFDHSPFCWPYNMSGQPAMSVPMHWNDGGLPVGVQFAGRYGDEKTLLLLAAQLEQAQPWAHRAPDLVLNS
ncbi:amidase [Polycladidibacter stylochi]|uniref:amidase n=1 Tax=Polycladidibacter stylochi TaxID=1807766 RepID=UPI000831657C|nr:amidase [Pseudovibrio stylochi]